MAGEKTDTGTSTSSRATDDPATASTGNTYLDLKVRAVSSGHTQTSMDTDAPSRPQQPKFPWMKKEVDLFVLAGYSLNPFEVLAGANKIWSQCYIYFEGFFHEPYNAEETRALIGTHGGDSKRAVQQLTVMVNPIETTAEQENLRKEWHTKGKKPMAVFFAPNVLLTSNKALSCVDPAKGIEIVYLGGVPKVSPSFDLAHEFGHLLIKKDLNHEALSSPLMHVERSSGNKIVELECRAARGDDKALLQILDKMNRKRN